MPNLFFFKPVEIYGWVLGSTSGFILNAIRAFLFISFAVSLTAYSSSTDSRLIIIISFSSAYLISSFVFATPLKTIFDGSIPAFNALKSSPLDTISAPLPSSANVFITLRLLFALIANDIQCFLENALSNLLNCSIKCFLE